MLEDRGTGWANWTLDNFGGNISYLDNFPFDLLEGLIDYFETGKEQDVEIDAEMVTYIIKISSNIAVEETVLYDSTIDFANDFICEIEKSLEAWSHFPVRRDSEEDYKELVEDIVKLRRLLMDEELIDQWIEIID